MSPEEQDLTAVAEQTCRRVADGCYYAEYEGSSDKLAAWALTLKAERDAERQEKQAFMAMFLSVKAERDALKALSEDERVWRHDAEDLISRLSVEVEALKAQLEKVRQGGWCYDCKQRMSDCTCKDWP